MTIVVIVWVCLITNKVQIYTDLGMIALDQGSSLWNQLQVAPQSLEAQTGLRETNLRLAKLFHKAVPLLEAAFHRFRAVLAISRNTSPNAREHTFWDPNSMAMRAFQFYYSQKRLQPALVLDQLLILSAKQWRLHVDQTGAADEGSSRYSSALGKTYRPSGAQRRTSGEAGYSGHFDVQLHLSDLTQSQEECKK
ncbi:hypothetical protein PtB15_11B674 [Puccinia triticina]|nr:hypothetical protein PtB15_11B674 [Puccinia triticina]